MKRNRASLCLVAMSFALGAIPPVHASAQTVHVTVSVSPPDVRPRAPDSPMTSERDSIGGAIGALWQQTGGPGGWLGMWHGGAFRVTSPQGTQGIGQRFDAGGIYSITDASRANPTFAVGGGIGTLYFAHRGPASFLGFPIEGEADCAPSPRGSIGRCQHFESGVIVWNAPHDRAFEVHGGIALLYSSLGGTGSWLGFPIGNEYDDNGLARSDFEGGSIVWTAATGAVALRR